jgi:hypothetical protein
MWFGWSLDLWEKIFFCVTAAAAVLGSISLLAAFSSAIIGYKISDVVTRESNEKIAESNARQAEAELKLEQLRKLSGPRGVDFDVLKKELEGKPKARVAIWYLPDSSDGYWFANKLFAALWNAGWQADHPIPIPDQMSKWWIG